MDLLSDQLKHLFEAQYISCQVFCLQTFSATFCIHSIWCRGINSSSFSSWILVQFMAPRCTVSIFNNLYFLKVELEIHMKGQIHSLLAKTTGSCLVSWVSETFLPLLMHGLIVDIALKKFGLLVWICSSTLRPLLFTCTFDMGFFSTPVLGDHICNLWTSDLS